MSDLRDKISCYREEVRVGEFSHDPELINEAPLMKVIFIISKINNLINCYIRLKKDMVKSSYFLIENVIYNDLRNDQNDSSLLSNLCVLFSIYLIVILIVIFILIIRQIVKWANEKKIGHFETGNMQITRFIDLNIRLGFPYLYKHLGGCEHLLIFTSIK